MPCNQFVDSKEIREKGLLKFRDISLNQYDWTIKDEKANFTKEEFPDIETCSISGNPRIFYTA